MKINKKILIPVFATAMGLSVVGGVSGAVAWYQYNTKAEASWVGASVADGGSILISKDDGTSWDRSIVLADSAAAKTLHPVTFPSFTGTGVPTGAKKHPAYGQTNPADWKAAVQNTDYYQYTFKLKTQKIIDNEYKGFAVAVKIKSFIFTAEAASSTDENSKANALKAMRVHFNAGSGNDAVYSSEAATTTLGGQLDLNGDDKADYQAGYSWDEGFGTTLTYGDSTKSYSSVALANDAAFFTTGSDGTLSVTMTIWMEGWHSFTEGDKSMWEPKNTGGAEIKFGITFGIEDSDLGIEA